MPSSKTQWPTIIQGGMGVGVSGWRLARAVSATGQLGVVSGTALDAVLVRRLQLGDPGGHIRRAIKCLPLPGVAQRILDRYFVASGKPEGQPFRAKPMPSERPSRGQTELLIASNFVEVLLARESHENPVGVNYLEKIQLPTLPSLYGAMLAGVSFVLMGAGIPKAIPGILDRLALNQPVQLQLDVSGSSAEPAATSLEPAAFHPGAAHLDRPRFLAIISSTPLATMLARRSTGKVDGFVVESHVAGGHNAPPRGLQQLTTSGEPIYTHRDTPDLDAIAALGLPFWLAGGRATPESLAAARKAGAAGVQIGTAFAYCEESGLEPRLKEKVLAMSRAATTRVFTDPVASPTSFPFKVVQVPDTLSDPRLAEARARRCDLGYLRQAYRKPDGSLGWRCPAEPVEDYVRKGGDLSESVGRKCLCNALMATIGLGQIQSNGDPEPALVTSGDDVVGIARFLRPGAASYRAVDVIEAMLASDVTTRSESARPPDAL